jgi:protein-S-isoprenylcysteine O-methyltransferase Ste14
LFTFLIPLLLGFALNCASAFTTAYTRLWGERGGRLASTILRDVFGIPVWAIGLCLAVVTASPEIFPSSLVTQIFGWLLIIAGAVIIILGLLSLGWRAATPSVKDTLVVHGLYANIRHPLYSGTFLEFVGLFLISPTIAVAIAVLLGIGWLLIQARLEEIDLLQRIPAYREYMKRVPRFVPHLKNPKPKI